MAVAVSRGSHGWVLHGFTATADPAKTSTFTVTSVRVSGPLWGLQSRSFGYDMRPNTRLTVTQFKRFFTKWWYAPKRMIWDGTVRLDPAADDFDIDLGDRRNRQAPPRPQGRCSRSVPAPTSAATPAAASIAPVQPPTPSRSSADAAASAPSSSSSTSTARPPDTAPLLPMADAVAVLAAGLGVLIVVLVSRWAGPRASSDQRSSRRME